MSLLNAFWQSFDTAGSTLDEHFAGFAAINDLTEEEADAIRTDIVTTLVTYFAQMVEDIHHAEQEDSNSKGLSPIGKIFDYFADDCLGLDEDSKALLARSLAASADEFDDDDDADEADEDKDDDDYKVKKFLKALTNTTPGPDKDYIDLDQDTDEQPDPYGNHFAGGVKVFDRRANRYGHGPNEETKTVRIKPKVPIKVVVNPRLLDIENKVGAGDLNLGSEQTLKGTTAAAATLHPNSMPSYSHGLSVAHHAVPGLTQYCDANDIRYASLGMGPGVQHLGFQGGDVRDKAARYLKRMFGQTSFKPFVRKTNESATKFVGASDLEESLSHKTENHDRLVQEALKFMRKSTPNTKYGDGAMAGLREQLQAQAKINDERPLFENDTSRDTKFLAKVDKARGSRG